jgi:hypothetical protein
MSRLIITGVTGCGKSLDILRNTNHSSSVAGSAILTQALASPQVAHVTTLSRRPPHDVTEGSKLTTIITPSTEYPRGFEEFPACLVEKLKAEGHTGVIWALGISQTQVNKDQYIQYVLQSMMIRS